MKKILLLCCLFCLTGCDVKYNLTITEKNINESVTILEKNDIISTGSIENRLSDLIDYNFDESSPIGFYNVSQQIGDTESGILMEYDYYYSNFASTSTFISTCYENSEFNYTDSTIEIDLSGQFKCWEYLNNSSNLTVNIKAPGTMVSNNATSINKDIYTWEFNKNTTDKSIRLNLKIKETEQTNSSTYIAKKETIISFIILVGTILGTIGIVAIAVLIIKKANKKNNKI